MQNGVPTDVIGLPTISVEWNIAATGDFLGTGQADLVWENTVTGQRSIWIMNNGVPVNVISLPTIPIRWNIAAAADFLGTGQADLVWENTVTGERSIWIMHNGVPQFVISLPTTRHGGFYCVRLINVHGTLCLPILIAVSKILSENACSPPEAAEGISLSFKQKYRRD